MRLWNGAEVHVDALIAMGANLTWDYPSDSVALDYEFVGHPAFNRDRGPVSVFAMRLHWEY
ncbi:MAG: hypothetical protein ACLPXZ_01550 [Mycobacterium sp.]